MCPNMGRGKTKARQAVQASGLRWAQLGQRAMRRVRRSRLVLQRAKAYSDAGLTKSNPDKRAVVQCVER